MSPSGHAAVPWGGAALLLAWGGAVATGVPELVASGGAGEGVAFPVAPLHADGPPLAHTGGFGEQTCQECHMDLELNSPLGQLTVEGIPERFEPGRAYIVTVLLHGEGMGRGGFQGAFRFQNGERGGSSAGSVVPVDDRTTVRREGTVEYVHHTAAGSVLDGEEAATWIFEWLAPDVSGDVAFHVAANSANGDNSPFGDLIYAAAHVSSTTAHGER